MFCAILMSGCHDERYEGETMNPVGDGGRCRAISHFLGSSGRGHGSESVIERSCCPEWTSSAERACTECSTYGVAKQVQRAPPHGVAHQLIMVARRSGINHRSHPLPCSLPAGKSVYASCQSCSSCSYPPISALISSPNSHHEALTQVKRGL